MSWPAPWAFALLALAAFRLVRLGGWDELSAPIRGWLTITDATYDACTPTLNETIAAGEDPWATMHPPSFSRRRWYFAKLIRCPWCAGAYIATASWLLWLVWPHAALLAATPLALSATIGLVAKNLDP